MECEIDISKTKKYLSKMSNLNIKPEIQKPSLLLEEVQVFSAYPGAEPEPVGFLSPSFCRFAPARPAEPSASTGRHLASHPPGCPQQPWVQAWGMRVLQPGSGVAALTAPSLVSPRLQICECQLKRPIGLEKNASALNFGE